MNRLFLYGRCAIAALGALLYAAPGPLHAGCGATFCTVNTDWDVQGLWTQPGVRFDLRYEYIDQDQPRAGTEAVDVGEIPRHHDEVSTLNRNLRATLDFTLSPRWGVSVGVPVIDRRHEHIHHHHGAALPQSWSFHELGDAAVVGRYQAGERWGLRLGLKLPTGRTDVRNAAGELAERSLQPGSGTYDGILGLYYQGRSGAADWFAQATYRRALHEDADYRPGEELGVDLGTAYPLSANWSGLLQLNASLKGRDSGAASEPEDTGGTFVFLSPGLSRQIGQAVQLYAFVQLPLYQDVNGVQLTADWAGVLGVSTRF